MRGTFPTFQSHLDLAHSFWKGVVKPGDTVIDATLGNGKDTLFLAELLQGTGRVIGYDIQPEALHSTNELLKKMCINNVHLHLNSHKSFFEKEARLIVYNLGYLPGGDKSLTTKTDTTMESIKSGLEIIQPLGGISITCYPGHPEGALEEKALLEFTKTLAAGKWSISFHQWINRRQSPSLIWIQKSGSHSS